MHQDVPISYIETSLRQGHGGCGLRDLCPQDKKKVAKLIRQVVDLQQEAEVQRSRSKVGARFCQLSLPMLENGILKYTSENTQLDIL